MTTEKNKLTTSQKLQEQYGRLTFARLLKASRECDEISLGGMAKKLGIKKAILNDYEEGLKKPTIKLAGIISKKLGYDSSVLQDLLKEDIKLEKMKVSASKLCPKCLINAQKAS